jgi:hypothetical protein
MPALMLYNAFSREDVHAIFSPDTIFTPQAGTWGLQGVVSIPDRPGDYVFFVTFGQSQGEHVFDEGITKDGVLSWQTQPQQDLNEKRVQQWIHHNEFENNIYLFLRTSSRRPYTYLGRLKYLSHDQERERPVYFQWQILDWSLSLEDQKTIGLAPQHEDNSQDQTALSDEQSAAVGQLFEVPAPKKTASFGLKTPQFRGQKRADYSVKDEKDRKLGEAGELAVIEKEFSQLVVNGRIDLAQKIIHVSKIEGDGAGYDIKSYHPNGIVKYIEVKTTRGGIATPFFMSLNEMRFSEIHAPNYILYRVFDFELDSKTGKHFTILGNIKKEAQFEAITFRVKI